MSEFTDGDVRNAVAFIPITTTGMKFSEAEAEKFDRWLAAHDAEVRAESDPAKDERLARYMAMVTPLGYHSALTVVQEMTKLIQAETAARQVDTTNHAIEGQL